jgi:hypothetical protein
MLSCQPTRCPTFRIDLETVGHFAMAKIKEAVLTVTRS